MRPPARLRARPRARRSTRRRSPRRARTPHSRSRTGERPGASRARPSPKEERSPGALLLCFLRGGHILRGAAAGLTLAALVLAAASPARAQLKELETRDLRLVYFDPS